MQSGLLQIQYIYKHKFELGENFLDGFNNCSIFGDIGTGDKKEFFLHITIIIDECLLSR